MESKHLAKLGRYPGMTMKVIAPIASINAAANNNVIYYYKPSIPCKLVGAKMHVLVVAAVALSAVATIVKQTALTDSDLKRDILTVGTLITAGTAVTGTDMLKFATTSVSAAANVTALPTPGANLMAAETNLNPETNDAIVVTLPCLANAAGALLSAWLELELMPI